jgi:hypothetical protein
MDIFFWLLTHGDNVLLWVLTAVGRALAEVGDAVLAVSQTYVDALKAANADGKLTDQEKAEAKAKALALIKQNLGPVGLRKLAKIIGVDVDGWLGTKLEAAVATLQTKSIALSVGETVKAGDVGKATTASVSVPR